MSLVLLFIRLFENLQQALQCGGPREYATEVFEAWWSLTDPRSLARGVQHPKVSKLPLIQLLDPRGVRGWLLLPVAAPRVSSPRFHRHGSNGENDSGDVKVCSLR